MHRERFELSIPYRRQGLNLLCIPVPPPMHKLKVVTERFELSCLKGQMLLKHPCIPFHHVTIIKTGKEGIEPPTNSLTVSRSTTELQPYGSEDFLNRNLSDKTIHDLLKVTTPKMVLLS